MCGDWRGQAWREGSAGRGPGTVRAAAAPASLEAGAPRGRRWPPSEDTQESPAPQQHRHGPQRRACVENARPDRWEPPAGRQGELVPAPRPWSVHRPGSVAVFMHNFQLFRAMRLSSESLALCTEQEFWKRFTSFPTKCRQTIRDLVFDSPFRSTSEARNRAGPLH